MVIPIGKSWRVVRSLVYNSAGMPEDHDSYAITNGEGIVAVFKDNDDAVLGALAPIMHDIISSYYRRYRLTNKPDELERLLLNMMQDIKTKVMLFESLEVA